MTGTKNWPATTQTETISDENAGNIRVRTLNNINIVHIIKSGATISISLDSIDDLITALQWAKWYLTEGKYNE